MSLPPVAGASPADSPGGEPEEPEESFDSLRQVGPFPLSGGRFFSYYMEGRMYEGCMRA